MPTRLEDLTRQRLEKLERIRARGIDPYPPRFQRTHTTEQAVASFSEVEGSPRPTISLVGRIMSSRSMGKAAFCDLRDGYGKVQLYFKQDNVGPDKYQLVKDLDLGDFVGVTGTLFRTHTGEITLQASDLTLLSKSLQPLPEKWHGLVDVEKRYRQRYLDLISNQDAKKIFIARSRIVKAMRRFLDDSGFMEVETPVLQPSPGGAAARPFITHHQALDQDLYLRIATELHLKRLIIGGIEKVYEIGRIFRNEGIDTKHNPEFTTLESYEAYADYNSVMAMVERMICAIVQEVHGGSKVEFNGNTIDFTPPWQRRTLRDAIKEDSGIDFEDYLDADSLRQVMSERGVRVTEAEGRGKLIDDLLSTFVEPKTIQPTFLIDYPVELSPLAKRKPDNPRLVERFEGFCGGMEICNAFSELNDPLDQRERFKQQARLREGGDDTAEAADEDFLMALEYGMPPTGGLGVGIDRLVMLLTNQQSIREVILFPQLKNKE